MNNEKCEEIILSLTPSKLTLYVWGRQLFYTKDICMLCLASESLPLSSTSDCKTAVQSIEKWYSNSWASAANFFTSVIVS